MANLRAYADAMKRAQGVDVLVTPEVGLGHDERSRKRNAAYGERITNLIGSNPCSTNSSESPATNLASCLAKEYGMALVVGTIDLQPCNRTQDPRCPSDGQYVFNTALAFNRQGDLVAKYHKFHLFTLCPHCFDHPPVPQECTFDLGLGVTFGMFICFDSLFPEPATTLLQQGVRHFVFPTSWENLPPILTATAWQQAWSRANNAVLLAANNGDGGAKSGSGIYQSGHALATFFNASSDADVLLVSKVVEADFKGMPATKGRTIIPPSSSPTTMIEPACGFLHCQVFRATSGAAGNISLARGNVSCTMDYSVVLGDDSYYALAIHSGLLWFGEFLRTDFCAIVHCDPGSPLCLIPDPLLKGIYSTGTVFERVSLRVKYSNVHESFFPMMTANHGNVTSPDHLQVDTSQSSSGIYGISTQNQTLVSLVAWGLPWV